jgi:hypothetical protein
MVSQIIACQLAYFEKEEGNSLVNALMNGLIDYLSISNQAVID